MVPGPTMKTAPVGLGSSRNTLRRIKSKCLFVCTHILLEDVLDAIVLEGGFIDDELDPEYFGEHIENIAQGQ
jgi:hypothetical protein